jgi:hypothetical protein
MNRSANSLRSDYDYEDPSLFRQAQSKAEVIEPRVGWRLFAIGRRRGRPELDDGVNEDGADVDEKLSESRARTTMTIACTGPAPGPGPGIGGGGGAAGAARLEANSQSPLAGAALNA